MTGVLALALLASASLAWSPAPFASLQPGVTSPEQARKMVGSAPFLDYRVEVVEGEMDLLIEAASDLDVDARAAARGKPTEEVRVLEWRNPEDFSEAARLVFDPSGRLWYAVLPVMPSEATPERAQSRFPEKPTLVEQDRRVADLLYHLRLYSYPQEGVAYLEKLPGVISSRVVFRSRAEASRGPSAAAPR